VTHVLFVFPVGALALDPCRFLLWRHFYEHIFYCI